MSEYQIGDIVWQLRRLTDALENYTESQQIRFDRIGDLTQAIESNTEAVRELVEVILQKRTEEETKALATESAPDTSWVDTATNLEGEALTADSSRV